MSRTDLISDAFTIIRNAITAGKQEVLIPWSRNLVKICEILKTEGYIENHKDIEAANFKQIKVYLRYQGKRNMIKALEKVSTPGRRAYVTKKNVPVVLRGYGVAIVSTSSGILSDKEARAKGLGGEVMGRVW